MSLTLDWEIDRKNIHISPCFFKRKKNFLAVDICTKIKLMSTIIQDVHDKILFYFKLLRTFFVLGYKKIQ